MANLVLTKRTQRRDPFPPGAHCANSENKATAAIVAENACSAVAMRYVKNGTLLRVPHFQNKATAGTPI